ncbi:hypothetical protein, partial [uncultured Psychrobacter sp.]|uniref:hypothetical protein n=1 Tax=uncultured Psychrobacter sp. TaxID=259303 RepID=UPI00261DB5CA
MNFFTKLLELKAMVSRWITLVSLLLLFPNIAAFAASCPTGYASSTIKPQEYNQWPLGSFKSTITAAGSSTDHDVVITGSM